MISATDGDCDNRQTGNTEVARNIQSNLRLAEILCLLYDDLDVSGTHSVEWNTLYGVLEHSTDLFSEGEGGVRVGTLLLEYLTAANVKSSRLTPKASNPRGKLEKPPSLKRMISKPGQPRKAAALENGQITVHKREEYDDFERGKFDTQVQRVHQVKKVRHCHFSLVAAGSM
jgi:hypothetical protein